MKSRRAATFASGRRRRTPRAADTARFRGFRVSGSRKRTRDCGKVQGFSASRIRASGFATCGTDRGRRATTMPAAISTPPATCTRLIGSESSTSAHDSGDERVQVGGERGPRRADAVERTNQSTLVRTSGPQRGEDEQCPDLPAQREVLTGRLLRARECDRDPAAGEHERRDPRRRVTPHQRGNRHRVGGPGRGRGDTEQDAGVAAADLAAGAERDEPHAAERHRRAGPEAKANAVETERQNEQGGEDRGRAEQQRDNRRRRRFKA